MCTDSPESPSPLAAQADTNGQLISNAAADRPDAPRWFQPPVQRVARFLESIENLASATHSLLLTVLLWIAMVRVDWRSVRSRQYNGFQRSFPPHVAVDAAAFLFKLQREDSTSTDEKVKQLLTLSSSLATIALVLAGEVRPRWLGEVLVAFLVACVVLCVSVLEVRAQMVPVPDDANSGGFDRFAWAHDLQRSYYANRASHASRTDRFRAATRYFRVALLIAAVLAAMTVRTPNSSQDLASAIHQLEVRPVRVKVLRDRPIDSTSPRGRLDGP